MSHYNTKFGITKTEQKYSNKTTDFAKQELYQHYNTIISEKCPITTQILVSQSQLFLITTHLYYILNITRPTVSPYNTIIGITKSVMSHYNTIIGITKPVISHYNTNIDITKSVMSHYNTIIGITKPVVSH